MEITGDAITQNRSCGARNCPIPSLEAGDGFGLSQWWRRWELTVCNLLRACTVVGGSVFQAGHRQGPCSIFKTSHSIGNACLSLVLAAALASWAEVQGALLQKGFSNPILNIHCTGIPLQERWLCSTLELAVFQQWAKWFGILLDDTKECYRNVSYEWKVSL